MYSRWQQDLLAAVPAAAVAVAAVERIERDANAAERWDAWWSDVLDEQPELRDGPPLANPYRPGGR